MSERIEVASETEVMLNIFMRNLKLVPYEKLGEMEMLNKMANDRKYSDNDVIEFAKHAYQNLIEYLNIKGISDEYLDRKLNRFK